MENWMGLLRIHVCRGINLAIRDVYSSDPYVILKMGKLVFSPFSICLFVRLHLQFWVFFVKFEFSCILQKLKTRAVKQNTNPQWNEDLTLSIEDPNLPITMARNTLPNFFFFFFHMYSMKWWFDNVVVLIHLYSLYTIRTGSH